MNEAKQLQEDLGVNTVVKLKYPVRLATGQMLESGEPSAVCAWAICAPSRI